MIKFQNHVHNFRAIAIMGVVCAHSLHNFTWPENSLLFRSLDTLFNQSTIWFAFISGFLFQHLLPKYETKKYYRSKLKNVITPYLIWSVPALIISLFIIRQNVPDSLYDSPIIEQILIFLVTGKHLAPYWYIPTITLIFLCAPLLVWADNRKTLYILLPFLIVLSGYLGRDGLRPLLHLPYYYSSVAKAVYLLAPYIMGMFTSRYHDKIISVMGSIHLPTIGIAAFFYFLHVENYNQQHLYIYLFKMITCFNLLYYLWRMDDILGDKLSIVAHLSFGIFFLHGFILGGVKPLYLLLSGSEALPLGNIFYYAFFCISVILLCLALLTFSKRLLGKNSRWVLGC